MGIVGIFCTFTVILQLGYLVFREYSLEVSGDVAKPTILIDAGHGGEDGGAVGYSGEVESHINLNIALKLQQLMVLYGMDSVLLREEDVSLHDETATSVKEKKNSDLKQRVALVNGYDHGFLLSIHQNAFTQEQYYGAQVFYTKETEDFAEYLQELLRVGLNPENERVSKPVAESLYLMNHVEVPAVLVECGFLSNEMEGKLLATEDYQQRIACLLAVGLLTGEFITGDGVVMSS